MKRPGEWVCRPSALRGLSRGCPASTPPRPPQTLPPSSTIRLPEALPSRPSAISSPLLNSDSRTVCLSVFIPQALCTYYSSGLSLSNLQGYCNLSLKLCQHLLADLCLYRLGMSHAQPLTVEGAGNSEIWLPSFPGR